jgi:DNA-binding protein Fis
MDSFEKVKVALQNSNGSQEMKKTSVHAVRSGASSHEATRTDAGFQETVMMDHGEGLDDSDFADVSGTLGQSTIPPCPAEFRSFIEETSLERLVFWKLENLVANLSTECLDTVELNVLDKVVTHVEKPLFALVLRKTAGNLSIAAKLLGCNRNTLHRKLKEFSIVPKDLRKMLRKGRIQKLVQFP